MSSGSSGTGANFPAAFASGETQGVNQAFQPFPYPNTTAAANSAYSGINNLSNSSAPAAVQGAAGANLGYAGQLGTLAGTQGLQGLAGQVGINAGNTQQLAQTAPATGQAYASQLAPYVTNALQTGFDPQQALYNQQFALQQQQNQAAQAMAGVGQSPYAAGLTSQGDQNFNIAWQNAQLGRQQTAAQTAEGLNSGAMQDYLGGLNAYNSLAGTAGSLAGQEGGLLSGAGNLLGQASGATGQFGSLESLAQALQNVPIQDLLAYLGQSTSNASAATAAQLGTLNASTNLYSATNQGNLAQQQLNNQQLGGLGQLGGTLGGAAILAGAL